ncbi:MAG TPA: DPP IV N-terminal domain-containing protein [Terriglobales bacterium]|nr:DPP IV N-terminal domain-containing protein [Terriglobales bacterium]
MTTTRSLTLILAALTAPLAAQQAAPPTAAASLVFQRTGPNYELAARWTAAKVDKLVFDTSVTPHWFSSSDKFWYSYKTSTGTAYYQVDPVKGAKTALFDHVQLAAQLTRLTGIPYDGEHLPIENVKLIRNDAALQFQLNVPREAVILGLAAESEDELAASGDGAQGDAQTGGRGGRAGAPPAGTRAVYFEYEFATSQAKLLGDFKPPARKPAWATISPDGKTVLFARGFNLYMMDAASYALALKDVNDTNIVETQLTTDGEKDYSYARPPMNNNAEDLGTQGGGAAGRGARGAGNGRGATPPNPKLHDNSKNPRTAAIRVVWSKDSSKFALTRVDDRKVADLWVIHSLHNPRPTLETYKYAMPGEENVPQYEMWVFDVAGKKATKVNLTGFKDQHIGIETERVTNRERDAMPAGQQPEAIWLGGANDKFYISETSRDLHKVDFATVATSDGTVNSIIQERANVYIDTKPLRLINHGTELLVWAETDGWGHYYLYGTDGTLKHQIDKGEFVANDIVAVDEATNTLYFTAMGYKAGENVYYNHLFRIGLDGTGMKMVDTGNAAHALTASDDGRYFVDTASRVDSAPESDLYDQAGTRVAKLETTDLRALNAAGYKFPQPFSVKADDGITDLYGVMYKPFDFDPNKKYPLIEYVYPGPQTESVSTNFTPKSAQMTLAQFGFIVIEVGNRGGSPLRDKWYHTYGYGNLRDYGLADKKRAAEELAQIYPYIDINRVGITGHSGGGFMSTAAMLVYPDFFKVAVSESGNHDNNVYNDTWSEKYNGIKEIDGPDGKVSFQYSIDRNSDLAANLKGHLMLSTGDMDNNVSMANTMRMANALIRANKRFDMVVLPGERHAYSSDTDYFFWRKADYFCQYLLGDAPHDAEMSELQREVAETGKKAAAAAPGGGN